MLRPLSSRIPPTEARRTLSLLTDSRAEQAPSGGPLGICLSWRPSCGYGRRLPRTGEPPAGWPALGIASWSNLIYLQLHRLRHPRLPPGPRAHRMPIPGIGESAPDFTAQTDAGTDLQLSSLRGSWVILFFYPKDDTPG